MPAPTQLIWFILTLGFSLAGQALLKKGVMLRLAGAQPTMGEFLREHLLGLALSPYILGGVALSGIGVICWAYVLSRFELSRAMPILGGLAYVAMFFVGRVILKEPTTWVNFGGILFIVAGLVLVSLRTA